MTTDRQKELQTAAAKMLPDLTLTMGFMEHQIDLISQIAVGLAERNELSDTDRELVEILKTVLEFKSVDFSNMQHPMESYKIPKLIESKKRTRIVQMQYLQAQVREGMF